MNGNSIMQLTKKLQVSNGGHILYFYDDLQHYLNNALSYIVTGLEHDHHILFIDSEEKNRLIEEKLKQILSNEQRCKVHFYDRCVFYGVHGDFNSQTIVNQLGEMLQPFLNKHISIRTWAHVDWKEQEGIADLLEKYEVIADSNVYGMGLLSVCAYDAKSVPASLLMKLMRSHEYLMTDNELIRSNLYKNTDETVIFPSLSVQSEMQSEMDLYKQKLDFVHVVSHEVRNPLTIIKAYASMVLKSESHLSPGSIEKMKSIADCVDIIDNEISYIIYTEQMLSNDLLWNKEMIRLLPSIQEVIDFMSIKARTQEIQLVYTLDLKGNEKLFNNTIGFKLILSNLLSNAIKYSHEHSKVIFSAVSDGKKVVMKIKDHGVGMHEHQLQNLFQKYGKFNQEKSGQGIGLYMVKKLLDHFEGTIHIQSTYNQGTEVRVELPLAES